MSSPWKRIVPCRGWFRPLIARSVVDFPAPFAPISVTISPASTRSETPFQRVDRAVVDVDVVELEDVARWRVLAHSVAPLPR